MCNMGLACIKNETAVPLKFMSKSINIKPAQFIINLLGLTPDLIPSWVTNMENELQDFTKLFSIAMSFIKNLFHTKNYDNLPSMTNFSFKLNNIIVEGIRTLTSYHMSQSSPPHPDPNCALVHDLPLHLPPNMEEFEKCALITQLNSMKFRKPTNTAETTTSTTGRPLHIVMKGVTNMMDKVPNLDRENYYTELATYANDKAKLKYRERTTKVATKKKVLTGKTISLNKYDTDQNDKFSYLDVTIGTKSFKFLLDTGASCSFIHKDLVEGHIVPSSVCISTAGSPPGTSNVAGTKRVEFSVDTQSNHVLKIQHEFIVLFDCNKCAGIIGQDILQDRFSKGMDFHKGLWKISLEGHDVSVPYSGNNGSNMCSTIDAFSIGPKQTKVALVKCSKIDTNFKDKYFFTEGHKVLNNIEIIPSMSIIRSDPIHGLSSLIQIINTSHCEVFVPAHTDLTQFSLSMPVNLPEIEIAEDIFLHTLQTKSLNNLVKSYCQTEYQMFSHNDDPSPIKSERFSEDLNHLSLNNFNLTPVQKTPLPPRLSPDIEAFDEYAQMLDDCAKNLTKNVTFTQTETTSLDGCKEGHRENIKTIEQANPELVLPDNYITLANEDTSTSLADSDVKPEVWSVSDIKLDHIPPDVRPKYEELMHRFSSIFARNSWDIGKTPLLEVRLETSRIPQSQKQRFIPNQKLAFVKKAIDELNSAGIIKKVRTWKTCSNMILVPKYKTVRCNTKADALRVDQSQIRAYRICVDLRNLNEALTVKCSSLSQPPEKLILPLANKLVTNLDICQAYFSIPLESESQSLTAFYVEQNVYDFNRLSQGLLPAPRIYDCFNEIIYDNDLLPEAASAALYKGDYSTPLTWEEFLLKYMDDSWNYTEFDFLKHLFYLEMQFYALARAGLKLSPHKCIIASTQVKVLGLQLDTQKATLTMDNLKALSILSWPDPQSCFEVHSRLYSLLYYAKFLPKIKELTLPLQELLRKKEFYWEDKQKKAWEEIKLLILLDLQLFIPSPEDQLYLITDASKISCASMLCVEKEGSLKIVASDSTIFNYADSLKSPFIKEAIGLMRGLKKFQSYFGSSRKPVIIFTDCRSLLYVSRKKEFDMSSYNISNFLLYFQTLYGFNIYHIDGLHNVYADLCSRAFSQSKFVNNNTYNMSKIQAETLPPLTVPFLADSDLLFEYLSRDPQHEIFDIHAKNRKKLCNPRPLTNLAKMFSSATPEEKYIASCRLLNGWNDKSLSKLDYTEKLNDKLGLNHIQSQTPKKPPLATPTIIAYHELITTNGMFLAYETVQLAPGAHYKIAHPLEIRANCRVDIKCTIPGLRMDISPQTSLQFDLILVNSLDTPLSLTKGDVFAYIYSNITASFHKTKPQGINEYSLKHNVLPFSGLRIEWDPTSHLPPPQISPQDCKSNRVMYFLNNILSEPLAKTYYADAMLKPNKLPIELFAELQQEDSFCINRRQNLDVNHFVIKQKVLYRVSQKQGVTQIYPVIPASLIHELVSFIHLKFGHPTMSGFLNIFKAHYYFPTIRTLIKARVKSCVVCAKLHVRPIYSKHVGEARSFQPSQPRESISLDIIPRLNITDNKDSAILLIIDNYSRFGSAMLLKNKSAKCISNALKNYFLMHQQPRHIFSDSEASIISAVQGLQKYLDIILQTSPNSTQFRNRTESSFKDLKHIVRRLIADPQRQLQSKEWDIALIYALQIFNAIPFKKNPVLTRELIHYNATLKTLPLIYLETDDFSAEDLDEMVQNMAIKKIRQKDNYSKDIIDNFSPGQIIYVRRADDPLVKSTFANNSNGPFKILTSDPITKTVRAVKHGNKAIYTIAFCNINKIPLSDLSLDLFIGFLEDRNQRDYSSRPKRTQPQQALKDKMAHLPGMDQQVLPLPVTPSVPVAKQLRRSKRHRLEKS